MVNGEALEIVNLLVAELKEMVYPGNKSDSFVFRVVAL
jgi:hypothetical protein